MSRLINLRTENKRNSKEAERLACNIPFRLVGPSTWERRHAALKLLIAYPCSFRLLRIGLSPLGEAARYRPLKPDRRRPNLRHFRLRPGNRSSVIRASVKFILGYRAPTIRHNYEGKLTYVRTPAGAKERDRPCVIRRFCASPIATWLTDIFIYV